MHRRRSVRLPRLVVLAAIAALVVGYVPLTALDHLHLHIERGLHFFHDHLHIGHHEHDYSAVTEDHHDGEPGDESNLGSTVVTLGQAAQVQPPAVEIEGSSSPVANHTVRQEAIAFDEPLHPSWDPRAPPA